MLSDRSEPKESSSSVVVGYCKGDYVQYQVSFTTYGIKSGSVQVRKGTVRERNGSATNSVEVQRPNLGIFKNL